MIANVIFDEMHMIHHCNCWLLLINTTDNKRCVTLRQSKGGEALTFSYCWRLYIGPVALCLIISAAAEPFVGFMINIWAVGFVALDELLCPLLPFMFHCPYSSHS